MERRAPAAVIVAVVQGRPGARQQFGQPRLALDQRQGGGILAVEIKKVPASSGFSAWRITVIFLAASFLAPD
ncbi:MAG: hypothetical protein JOY83_18560 [Alphaproteobacteria bacterium]|nr:hypothetical protein [Alphaproteobacteria bacterium]